tara:strand:+ start:1280 stop:1396 length:117 start_codon:yes stop_codon:yes gene_type:complete
VWIYPETKSSSQSLKLGVEPETFETINKKEATKKATRR